MLALAVAPSASAAAAAALPAAAARRPAAARPRLAHAQLRPAPAAALAAWTQVQRRRQCAVLVCRAGAAPVTDVEAARKLLDGPSMVLDVRPAAAFDDARITKPPRKTCNVPHAAGQDGAAFVARAAAALPNRAARVIVMCADGGADSADAADLLAGAGFTAVSQMQGGFEGYSQVWGPSGKRRPPAGRWVSTGKEALKFGLNIPGVAESYDEGGNLVTARWAKGLAPGEELPG